MIKQFLQDYPSNNGRSDMLPIIFKDKEIFFYLSSSEVFFSDKLQKKLLENCKVSNRYYILTRVYYIDSAHIDCDYVTDWKTLGEQVYLHNKENQDFPVECNKYMSSIKGRLKECMVNYEFRDQDILGFQFLLYRVSYTNNVIPKNINLKSLGGHKDFINTSKTNLGFSLLPLKSSEDKYGKLLDKVLDKGGVKEVIYPDGSHINVLDKINKYRADNRKAQLVKPDTKFYLLEETNNLAIVNINNNDERDIELYNGDGIKLTNIVEKVLDKDNFYRKVGNVKAYINTKNGVYKKTVSLQFNHIQPKKTSGYYSKLVYSDPRLGTLDLETYIDPNGKSKTYALGYFAHRITRIFYIENDLDSDKLIMKCLDSMLKEVYNGYTFYVHNLGRFDIYFLLKVIVNANIQNPDIYNYNIITRDKTIICINLSKRVGKKTNRIKIADSYNFLSSSLHKLCKTFNCETQKGFFPYDFVKNDTIFYIGKKPNIKFFADLDMSLYNSIDVDNWSTKQETIKYLKHDLMSLYEVMNKFKNSIFIEHYVHVSKSLTIAGLAMNIFTEKFYNNNIPLINKKSVYNDIRMSYFGGVTEVYKPFGEGLYYYDVNSLYPFAALNVMPGLNSTYTDNINLNLKDLVDEENNMFGFYYCKVRTNDSYLGLLPYRYNNSIIMPNGSFEGWYFSEELKYAYENGYDITLIKGYSFDKSYNVFDKYVKHFYNLKSSTQDPVEKSIAKSLLNNLLGRFGMNLDKSVTELVNDEKFNELLQSKNIISVIHIGDKKLVTHSSKVSMGICDRHEVDFRETFSKDVKNNAKSSLTKEKIQDVSIAVASAITSYARIHMNKIKLHILKNGGSIYYTDTDSIVTNLCLDKDYVGSEIGKFKLEHKVKQGYFISNKNYCLKDWDGKVYITRCGVNSKGLTFEDFEKLYKGIDVISTRSESIKNYTEGFVNIGVDRDVILSADSYTKRSKLYINGVWTDTKAISLNTNNDK